MQNHYFITETPSTNALLLQMLKNTRLAEGFVVQTDFQTDGKGQMGNHWESEVGKNLMFSMVLYPIFVKPEEQFLLSQLVSVAIKNALDKYANNISVKWPNDIYWNDKKIAGILLENALQGNKIKHVIIGIGLNVNQSEFLSDAPNPVSLSQIAGKQLDARLILEDIYICIMELYKNLNAEEIREQYFKILYRNEGYHGFVVGNETFQAKIFAVHPDGKLELECADGEYKSFYFKEVAFHLTANL